MASASRIPGALHVVAELGAYEAGLDVLHAYAAQVGELALRYESFAVAGNAGQMLVVYHAEPGSPSEQAMARGRLPGAFTDTASAAAPSASG